MMKRFSRFFLYGFILALVSGCSAAKVNNTLTPESTVQQLPLNIVATYPHDVQAFTEGLLFDRGALYESIGLTGHSAVRKVELKSGKVLLEHRLPADVFGEGLALLNGNLLQLTWKKELAYLYHPDDFKQIGMRHYSGEGWGLTSDGKSWISSNGSDTLTWRDEKTFAPQRTVQVTWNGNPVKNLNELEWIDGAVWANVWYENWILQIDPRDGKVLSYIDISSIVPRSADAEDVANGIAYDRKEKRIFITGKRWPVLYEINIDKQ